MKREATDTITYRGIDIDIYPDENPWSPDEGGDDSVFIVHDHRDFYVKREGYDPQSIYLDLKAGKRLYNGRWIFPLYAYIHSGVALSLGRNTYPFTCPWDTSFAGFVLVQRVKGWTWTREKALKIAQGEVEQWNMYLSGDVWGYISEAGSCFNWYGDEGKKEMIIEAKHEIDAMLKDKAHDHFKTLKTWIKNHVPLYVRTPFEIPNADLCVS